MDSLGHFKTVAFDFKVMRDLIGKSPPEEREMHRAQGMVDFRAWLAVVPKVYLPQVMEIIEELAREFIGMIYDDQSMHRLAHAIYDQVWERIQPILPPGLDLLHDKPI